MGRTGGSLAPTCPPRRRPVLPLMARWPHAQGLGAWAAGRPGGARATERGAAVPWAASPAPGPGWGPVPPGSTATANPRCRTRENLVPTEPAPGRGRSGTCRIGTGQQARGETGSLRSGSGSHTHVIPPQGPPTPSGHPQEPRDVQWTSRHLQVGGRPELLVVLDQSSRPGTCRASPGQRRAVRPEHGQDPGWTWGDRDTGSRPRTRRPSGPLGAPPQRPRLAAGRAAHPGCGEDPAGSGGCSSEVLLLVSRGWALLAAQARAPGGPREAPPTRPPQASTGPKGTECEAGAHSRRATPGRAWPRLPPSVRSRVPQGGAVGSAGTGAPQTDPQPGGPSPLVPRRLPSPR